MSGAGLAAPRARDKREVAMLTLSIIKADTGGFVGHSARCIRTCLLPPERRSMPRWRMGC